MNEAQMQATFQEKGWLVIENVFAPDEVDRIAALALEHADQDEAAAEDGTVAPRKVASPFFKDERFRAFALNERLRHLVSVLFGGKTPLLATDQIFLKPPRHGSAKPYHQDNAYFRCDPDGETITAWIALDDVDESNGCLRYIDGSHREALLEHKPVAGEPHNMSPDPSLIDLSRESLAPVGKGGVVFHHSNVLHTSHRNHSDRWRRGYATHWVSPDVTSQGPVLDNAYFKQDLYPAWAQATA